MDPDMLEMVHQLIDLLEDWLMSEDSPPESLLEQLRTLVLAGEISKHQALMFCSLYLSSQDQEIQVPQALYPVAQKLYLLGMEMEGARVQ